MYHGLCADVCAPEATYDATQGDFDATLTAMAARGFRTISMQAYVDWFAGGPKPEGRPVLITFDDGRRLAYELGDPILAKHRARATMYVITSYLRHEQPKADDRVMAWSQVVEAFASARWDIELHAHVGHRQISVAGGTDSNGQPSQGPFYAWRRWLDNGTESFAQWRDRVTADLDLGERLLASRLPGWKPRSFAVPFGDYGQKRSNDPAIPIAMAEILDARYAAWFVQPSTRELPTPSRDGNGGNVNTSHRSGRYTIVRTTTTSQIMAWLEAAYAPRSTQ